MGWGIFGSSAWGPSNAMQEAEGYPREAGNWNWEQYKDWLKYANDARDKGNYGLEYELEHNRNRAENGLGTPGDIRTTGSQIRPGTEAYITGQKARTASIKEGYENMTPWQEYMAEIERNTGLSRDVIDQANDQTEAEIRDTATRAFGREDTANAAIQGDISGRYGKMMDLARTDYDAMRGQGRDVYGKLKTQAEEAYDQAFEDVEYTKPTGEFAAARAARSFAPAMASTGGRLRRAGLDSSSPQAMNAYRGVEAARSRAMDDAQIEGREKYSSARINLGLDRQGTRERLGTGALNFDTDLNKEGSGIIRDLDREQGDLYRTNEVRHSTTGNAIDRDRSGRQTDQINTQEGRLQRWLDDRSENTLMRRGLEHEDWGTRSGLTDREGMDEREAMDEREREFNAGMNFTTTDAAARDAAAQGVGNYGRYHMNYSLPAANTAQGFDDRAANRYKTAYDIEAPNAGYLTKAILTAAGAIPVVGPIIAGAAKASGQMEPTPPISQQGGQPQQQQQQQQSPYSSAYSAQDWFKPMTQWRQNRNPNQVTIKQNSSGYMTSGGR
jgi:hypothetical protein